MPVSREVSPAPEAPDRAAPVRGATLASALASRRAALQGAIEDAIRAASSGGTWWAASLRRAAQAAAAAAVLAQAERRRELARALILVEADLRGARYLGCAGALHVLRRAQGEARDASA